MRHHPSFKAAAESEARTSVSCVEPSSTAAKAIDAADSPPIVTKLTTYSLIDLFAGCGGMTRGFEDTGRFRSTFAVESDTDAAETYRVNFGRHIVEGLIEEV